MNTTISIIAIAVSILSLGVAIYSLWRTVKIQTSDYGPYLQIENESLKIGSPVLLHFNYSASIRNKGLKPLPIKGVWMRYGEQKADGAFRRYSIYSRFTLSPNEKRELDFKRTKTEVIEMFHELEVPECVFTLEVEYQDLLKKTRLAKRNLGGYTFINGEFGLLFTYQNEMIA